MFLAPTRKSKPATFLRVGASWFYGVRCTLTRNYPTSPIPSVRGPGSIPGGTFRTNMLDSRFLRVGASNQRDS